MLGNAQRIVSTFLALGIFARGLGYDGGMMEVKNMRKKLMEISKCYDCHHTSTIDCRNHKCFKTGKVIYDIFGEIPEWCPLPDPITD